MSCAETCKIQCVCSCHDCKRCLASQIRQQRKMLERYSHNPYYLVEAGSAEIVLFTLVKKYNHMYGNHLTFWENKYEQCYDTYFS